MRDALWPHREGSLRCARGDGGARAAALLVLLLITLTACRPPHRAEKTLHATNRDRAPVMNALAPQAVVLITKLRQPESALHDPQQDVYFISNMNGGLLDRDDNGFISRVDAKTLHVELKWIESGRNGVHLDAPKGMAIVGDTLYVSDITGVRKFDRKNGAPLGEITLAGTTLINDITTDGSSIYVSDTGLQPTAGNSFAPTGTDAIWKITNDRPERYATGDTLGHPNGVDWVDGKLRVVTFGGHELFDLAGGKKSHVVQLPGGQLDGLVHLANGDVVITSWLGNEIYRGPAGGPFHTILGGIDAPADIGYDAVRGRLLVPAGNQVSIHVVK
jgi:hypothetical protein